MNLQTNPRSALFAFAAVFFLLLLGNVVAINLMFYLSQEWAQGLWPLFDFDGERNIPALFSSLGLMSCAFVLGLIGVTRHRQNRGGYDWISLAAIFIFLAINRSVGLLEFSSLGLLGATLLILCGLYARWFAQLSSASKRTFAIAGLSYLAGSFAVGMARTSHVAVNGADNVTFALLSTCQGSLELLAIGVFFYALLCSLTEQFGVLKIKVEKDPGLGFIEELKYRIALPDMGR